LLCRVNNKPIIYAKTTHQKHRLGPQSNLVHKSIFHKTWDPTLGLGLASGGLDMGIDVFPIVAAGDATKIDNPADTADPTHLS
jgi:hypothetical protein